MLRYSLLFLIVLSLVGFSSAYGATIKQTLDGAVDLTIEYPDSVIIGKKFSVSIFIQNNGWEDKKDISVVITSHDNSIISKNQTLSIERLSKNGSFGGTLEFDTGVKSEPGIHYLNAVYSQVLLSNNETPTAPTVKNIALQLSVKEEPEVHLNTITPSSIFPNAEFPFDIEIISKDISIKNVTLQINPPLGVTIRGQNFYTYSIIQQNTPQFVRVQIITNPEEITSEHKIPFEVSLEYTDDFGETKTMSKTVSPLLRPRTFMEFTTDGGVWVGGMFLAPYVSVGTIIGIPAGALFSLMLRRLQKKKKTKKK